MAEAAHKPVMINEMLAELSPRDGGTYVDATFGAGGYSRAILESSACRLFSIDRDPSVSQIAQKLAEEFPGRFVFLAGRFSDMLELLAAEGVDEVDGVVMDIGVSSMQVDEAERGFSFKKDGPLDMRMASEGLSAADIVNEYSEEQLADILYEYGEEKASRRIAKAIIKARSEAPILRTNVLADIVRNACGARRSPAPSAIDPATRTFQALRIAVNNELEELESGLDAAEKLLKPGGKLVVVVFHSLEDRIVKRYLTSRAQSAPVLSRHLPPVPASQAALRTFALPKPWMITPTQQEVAANPRARSAKLRVAMRVAAEGPGQ